MAKLSNTCYEIKNTKNIRAKASKKHESSIIISSISDSESYLSRDSEWYKIIQPDIGKEINELDHVVTSNIKNKNKFDDAIQYKPDFYNTFG